MRGRTQRIGAKVAQIRVARLSGAIVSFLSVMMSHRFGRAPRITAADYSTLSARGATTMAKLERPVTDDFNERHGPRLSWAASVQREYCMLLFFTDVDRKSRLTTKTIRGSIAPLCADLSDVSRGLNYG